MAADAALSFAEPLIQTALIGEALDTGPAAVFVLGDDRRYVAVNETACRLLGYERAELLALDPAAVAPEVDIGERLRELERSGALAGTTMLRTKTGERVAFSYRAAPARVAHMNVWISVGFAV